MALIDKLTAIGNAIREKTGKEDLIPLDDMPSEIRSISQSGGDNYYDIFWDAYQENGTRTTYTDAFSSISGTKDENYVTHQLWDNNSFKPKYDMRPINAVRMFESMGAPNDTRFDFEAHLIECGVELDCSAVTNAQHMFAKTNMTVIPVLNFSEHITSLDRTFYNSKVQVIRKLKTHANLTYHSTFYGCTALEEIRFEGVIGQSVNFGQSANLSSESVQNIIDCLADLTDGTAQTLTLHADVKENLTDEQIATITNKNWSLA